MKTMLMFVLVMIMLLFVLIMMMLILPTYLGLAVHKGGGYR